MAEPVDLDSSVFDDNAKLSTADDVAIRAEFREMTVAEAERRWPDLCAACGGAARLLAFRRMVNNRIGTVKAVPGTDVRTSGTAGDDR